MPFSSRRYLKKLDSSSSVGIQFKNSADLGECAKNSIQAFSYLPLLVPLIVARAASRDNFDDIFISWKIRAKLQFGDILLAFYSDFLILRHFCEKIFLLRETNLSFCLPLSLYNFEPYWTKLIFDLLNIFLTEIVHLILE